MTEDNPNTPPRNKKSRGRPNALETRPIDSGNNLPQIGFIRLDSVLAVIPVSKSTLLKAIQDGLFPKPVKFGRSSLWRASDLHRFIENGTYQPQPNTDAVCPIHSTLQGDE